MEELFLMKIVALDNKVRAYKKLLDKKDELAEQTKLNNKELDRKIGRASCRERVFITV